MNGTLFWWNGKRFRLITISRRNIKIWLARLAGTRCSELRLRDQLVLHGGQVVERRRSEFRRRYRSGARKAGAQ